MRIPMTFRARVAVVSAAILAVAGAARAQFAPPTCVPPDCNPQVIQNISLSSPAQSASFNVAGSGGVGAKFEAGRQAPTFGSATDYLFYGNVNGASTAGYLMLLQTGGADRLKVSLAGQEQLPLGSVGAPSYSFLTDTNTGIYSSAADTLQLVTGGANRLTVGPTGTVTIAGDLVVGGTFNISANSITSGTLNDARLSSNVALYNANGTFTGNNGFAGMTSYGSAALALAPAQNLIYGNVDAASTGSLLLLQTESADRFRVSANGNVAFTGTLTSGTVPWARLGSFPAACPFGQYVTSVGGTLTCSTPPGTGDPSAADDFTGSGTAGYHAKFTGPVSLGNSAIYEDGSGNLGLGTTTPSAKLSVNNGSINVNSGTVSTYLVAAGATGVTGQVVGVGSTGVAGNGSSYGVYGSSGGYGVYGYNTAAGGSGAGVYGYGTGTHPGIQGDSQSGWGGSFSSLYVTPGTSYFASGVTLNGGATVGAGAGFTLGSNGGDIAGANGRMSYNSATNKFRCYEGGAWKDCISGGVTSLAAGAGINVSAPTGAVTITNTGILGGGSVNALPKFTAGTTLGNSIITDNGATATVGGALAVTGNATVGGVSVCRQDGTNCPPATETDTLATVTGRGSTTLTTVGIGTVSKTSGAAITATGSSYAVWGQAGAGGTTFYGYGGATGGNFQGSSIGAYGAGATYGLEGLGGGNGSYGVYGHSSYTGSYGGVFQGVGYGVYASGTTGVYATASSIGTYSYGGSVGVQAAGNTAVSAGGTSTGVSASGNSYGVYATAPGSGTGVYAQTSSGSALYGYASGGGFALYASGRMTVTGTTAIFGELDAYNSIYLVVGQAYKPGGGSWAVYSDRRLKEDVSSFKDGLDLIRKVNPVNYTYNGLGEMPEGYHGIGVIAQDLKEIAPYMVAQDMKKLRPEDVEETALYTVDPSAFTYITINALKELDLRDADQDERIRALEAEIESLKDRLEALER